MPVKRQWTAEEDDAIRTSKDRGETIPALSARLNIKYQTVKARREMLIKFPKDATEPSKKRLIEVTCFCCQEKWHSDQADVRKCPRCKRLGHDLPCYEMRWI